MASLRAREWAKWVAEMVAQVVKNEARVRWLGRVGWQSMAMKWRRERRVLALAEMSVVHETMLGGYGRWWKSERA